MIKHHSAVGLVDRMESEGLVRRKIDPADRRSVELVVTPKGKRAFERLAATHRAELARIGPQLKEFFEYVSTRVPRRPK
jgi:DNA-binding MarR family transcriptional regulator